MSPGRRREDNPHSLIKTADLFVAAVMGAAVAVLAIGLAEFVLGVGQVFRCVL
jgi:hypothetical protein